MRERQSIRSDRHRDNPYRGYGRSSDPFASADWAAFFPVSTEKDLL